LRRVQAQIEELLAKAERLEAEGRPKAVRFAMPEEGKTAWNDLIRGEVEFENRLLDDFVMLKADGFPTYLLAVAVDDHEMGMSHVIRGEDLISATPRQMHIFRAMGWALPEYAHIPLILGPDRSKMSKRHGATSVSEYREQGYLPEAMVNFIALLGWSPGDDREILSREEMVEAFSLEGIGKSGAVFDLEKLNWMNGVYLRHLPEDRYMALAKPFLEKAGLLQGEFFDDAYVTKALLLEQERAKRLGELPGLTEFFFRDPDRYEEKGVRKWFQRAGAGELLGAVRAGLEAVESFEAGPLERALRALGKELGTGAGPVIHTTRLAVTGRTAGPGLFELLAVVGKERVVSRLGRAAACVGGAQKP